MNHTRNLTVIVTAIFTLLVILACGLSGGEETPQTPDIPGVTEAPAAANPSQGRCGDGVCDGPEDDESCPADCAPGETPPEGQPAEPGPGERPCGDGVCDGPEDASNCPQDCGEGGAPPSEDSPPTVGEPLKGTGTPDYEPPINVFLVLHIDPDMAGEQFTFSATPLDYQRTHDGIDWLMQEAALHDLRFSVLYNGWYPLEALETGDLSQFQSLLDGGHEIGTHAHRLTYDPAQDLWTARVEELSFYGRPNYDPVLARQTWDDATGYVNAMLQAIGATGQNQIMSTRTFQFTDEATLMDEYGFTIAAGNRAELSINYFGHAVWNPWRPAANDEPGHDLEEDLSTAFITIDHLAQIGSHEVAHPVDMTIPQLQRRFLMLYVEWLARVRTGAEDKVWTFGFVYHPNYTDKYLGDLSAFLDWLDKNFIGVTTPEGYTIARYATIGEIAQEFEAWEAAYPGTSSFNYVRGDPYPYTYATVPTMLDGFAYQARLDLGAGVTCFRFSSDGRQIYLIWSDQGEQVVGLPELSGQVRVTNMAGQESLQDAAMIPLTGEPQFVEPLE